jgi:hypothetical protein
MTLLEHQSDFTSNSGDLRSCAENLDALPPWGEADIKQRLRITGHAVAIYFPVAFVLGIAVLLFITMIVLHIYPLVASDYDDPAIWYWHSDSEMRSARVRGWVVFSVLCWLKLWTLVSLYRAITTSPGQIPDTVEWNLVDASMEVLEASVAHERRKDGDLRHCSICVKLKPDRAHHCRLCDVCVLKMDHHCPWIANCVGYFNYKYFFLLVLYATLGLLLFTGTFWETVVITLNNEHSSTGLCLFVVSVYSLGCLLGVVLVSFMCFHCYLITSSMSTIEFCEKRKKWDSQDSLYKLPLYKAWQEALGKNPWWWCFPFYFRDSEETGTSFLKAA